MGRVGVGVFGQPCAIKANKQDEYFSGGQKTTGKEAKGVYYVDQLLQKRIILFYFTFCFLSVQTFIRQGGR